MKINVKISWMIIFIIAELCGDAFSAKHVYIRLTHKESYSNDVSYKTQEFVQLKPGGRLQRELDEFTNSDNVNDNNLEKENPELETELKGLYQDEDKEGWHTVSTGRLKKLKQYLKHKLSNYTNSKESYFYKSKTTKNNNDDEKSNSPKQYKDIYANDNDIDNVHKPSAPEAQETVWRYGLRHLVKRSNNSIDVHHNKTQKTVWNNGLQYLVKRSNHFIDANDDWEVFYSTTSANPKATPGLDDFEITDADIKEGHKNNVAFIVKMVFVTLGTVFVICVLGYCFIKDPKAFLVVFSTGCPCLFYACPCLWKLLQTFLHPEQIMQAQMNKYMPGVIIHEDGRLEHYKPTPEEMDIVFEIIDEIMD